MKSRLISIKKIVENEVGHRIDTKNRCRSYTYARAIYCQIAREMGGERPISLKEIGEVINRDHASVLHNLKIVFPFAMKETSFRFLYLSLKAVFVDNQEGEETFDQIESLRQRVLMLEKHNSSLRQKLDLIKFGKSKFDSLVDELAKEEIDEVYEKMSIFVRAIKSRVYL